MKCRFLALGLAACAATSGAGLGAPSRAFTYDDLYRIVSVGSPQLAPDEKHVAAIVTRIDRTNDTRHRTLVLIDVASGAQQPIAGERGGVGSPQWSPAGDRIAYIADANGHRQVYVAAADGSGERRVTDAPEGVTEFAWAPDGTAIAYIAVDPQPARSGDARFLDGYTVGNDAALATGPARDAHVWLQPLEGAGARALTHGAGTATYGDAESTLSFSPDGRTLAYLHAPDALGNDADRATIRLIDVATATERDAAAPRTNLRDPLFAPAGARLAYAHSDGPAEANLTHAYVAAPDGTGAANVSAGIDRSVRDIGWQPGTAVLAFIVVDGTRNVLYRVDAGGAPRRVALGDVSVQSGITGALGRDGAFAFVGSTTDRPSELYFATPDGAPRRLTSFNDDVATLALGTSERVTYPTTTGVRGDAVLIRPPSFTPARRYPLVVIIHGGPTSASLETFDELAQLMAARGWLVLEPNYRGSTNAGLRYQRAVRGDKLRGPGEDIDAAIAAVSARGIVDAHRLAVSGWSYGAGMTLWMTESRHDWRAAVAGAAVTDIAADYATADDIGSDRALVPGSPLVGRSRVTARAESPITYVEQVRTPLLLFTDRGDTRVSPVGVYEFYHALRDLGRPAELVAYPVSGHFPSDPVRTADVYRRWIAFIAEHFAS